MNQPGFDWFGTAVPDRPRAPYARGSATSKDAAKRAEAFIGQQCERVLAWFQEQGVHGATQKQASDATGIERMSMCGRVNALEAAGKLVKTARRVDGCQVYRAVS